MKQVDVEQQRFTDLNGAAAILRCNEKTVRRLIAAGELRAYKLGRKAVRIRLTDLEAALRPMGGAA